MPSVSEMTPGARLFDITNRYDEARTQFINSRLGSEALQGYNTNLTDFRQMVENPAVDDAVINELDAALAASLVEPTSEEFDAMHIRKLVLLGGYRVLGVHPGNLSVSRHIETGTLQSIILTATAVGGEIILIKRGFWMETNPPVAKSEYKPTTIADKRVILQTMLAIAAELND